MAKVQSVSRRDELAVFYGTAQAMLNKATAYLSTGKSWLLVLLLLAALALRLRGIGFGLPGLNDPDELMFELGALKMLRGATLNPGWFGHPATTTIYVLAIVNIALFGTGYFMGWFSSARQFGEMIYTNPSWMILPGRVAMALFAVGTVYLTYRLASRLLGRGAGLAAAALLAVNPVHITYSQIIRSDAMACFFMTLCLLAAVDIARTDRRRDYVLAALWLGFAIATKWPFALSGLAVFGAVALRVRSCGLGVRQALVRLAGFGALSLLFLVATSPYLLLDAATVVRNLTGEGQAHHLGASGGLPWENAWWYISGPLYSGFGVLGMILLGWGIVRLGRHRELLAVLAPVGSALFLLLCVQHLIWERWALPLMPIGAIVAAFGLADMGEQLKRRLPSARSVMLALAVLGAAILPLVVHANDNSRERTHDTRQLASDWARKHVAGGSAVMVEHFAFDLEAQPWRFLFPLGDLGCVDVKSMLRGKISYAMIDAARGTRSNLDYGTLAPERRDTCRADYAILTQYDRYRAEQDAFPAEFAAYRALLKQGSIVATFRPLPGEIGGPVTRIIRFRK